MARILVWCLLPLTALADGFPEVLSKPGPTLVARAENPWKWPAPQVFTATFEKRRATRAPYRLLYADVVGADRPQLPVDAPFPDSEALQVIFAAGGDVERGKALFLESVTAEGTVLSPVLVLGENTWANGRSWKVVRRTGAKVEARAGTAVGRITVTGVVEAPVASEVVLADWTYAATLLQASGPLYLDDETADQTRYAFGRSKKHPQGVGLDEALKSGSVDRVREAVKGLNRWDDRWAGVIALAQEKKDDELLLSAYRRYRPMGGCSMDSRPAELAREYAEVCDRRGDLGCFLQLMVRVMGDQFDRVAWSSYGEASHSTQAERLAATGIDVDRFLLGLLFQLPDAPDLGRNSELNAWRLARAIKEAGRIDFFEKQLPVLTADETVDPYNRLRATEAWVWLMEKDKTPWPVLKKNVGTVKLHPVAQQWWDEVQRQRAKKALELEP